MKKSLKKLVIAASLMPAISMGATLEERVAELEAAQSLNIFKFSGSLETRYDGIDAKQAKGVTTAYDEHVDYMRLKASLNMDADVNQYIKFYSRLTTSKFFNTFNAPKANSTTAPSTSQDLSVAKDERGAQVYLEKAYADVMIPNSGAVFSFGRLSTFDGPPFNLPHGRPRMGTYPGLLYNAELDGLAFTYNTAVGDGNMAFRIVNTPFSYYADASGTIGSNGLLNSPKVGGNKSDTMPALASAMVEYSNNNFAVGALTVIAQAWQTGWLNINASEITGLGTGAGAIGFRVGAQALHVDISNVMGSNFDFSATMLSSRVENRGSITGLAVGTIYGYGASKDGESLSDTSTLLAGRYQFGKTYVGAEYLIGGKKAFVFDANNDAISNFYSTTGTGTHAYVLHKFMPELGLRLGYMNQKYDKTSFTVGAQKDSDRKVDTVYANLRLDF